MNSDSFREIISVLLCCCRRMSMSSLGRGILRSKDLLAVLVDPLRLMDGGLVLQGVVREEMEDGVGLSPRFLLVPLLVAVAGTGEEARIFHRPSRAD
jgi:hypothetical protein